MPEDAAPRRELMELDRRALLNFLDQLREAHESTPDRAVFPAVLDRIQGALPHSWWTHLVVFQRALWSLGSEWDVEAGRRVLRAFGDIDSVEEAEFVAVYLDVMGDVIGFDNRRALARRIVELSRDPVSRLQYRVFEQLELLKIGEEDAALDGIRQAVALLEVEIVRGDLDPVEDLCRLEWQRGRAFSILGDLGGAHEDYFKAIASLSVCVDDINYTDSGRSAILRDLGYCYIRVADFEIACQTLERSIEKADSSLARVFLAESYLGCERSEDAARELDGVEWESLSSENRFDWARVSGELALAMADEVRGRLTLTRFNSLQGLPAIFERQRHGAVMAIVAAATPQQTVLSEIRTMVASLVSAQVRSGYVIDAIRADTEGLVDAQLSTDALEALERQAARDNLTEDRRLASTTSQRVAKLVGKRVAKAVLGEVEDGVLDAAEELVGPTEEG